MDHLMAGPSGVKSMTRMQFYIIMQGYEHLDINQKLIEAELSLLNSKNYSESELRDAKHKLSYVKSEIRRRWTQSHYKEEVFLKKNNFWLQGLIVLPSSTARSGRPPKAFSDCSERSQRRKTETLRHETGLEELTVATHMKLRAEGKADAADVIKGITKSPTRASKYKKAYSRASKEPSEPTEQLTPLQALSMFVEAGLSRKQYEVIRSYNKKMYLCYSVIQKAKKECYPLATSYIVTASCAEVNLQELLDHTVTRLLTYLTEIIQTLNEDDRKTLTLMCKWGSDGSQQVQYKQKFENEGESDGNIFQSSFVPLQLTCGIANKKIIWQNPTPSSPRYCRPIRIRFIKETADITTQEVEYINEKIESLEATEVRQLNYDFSVQHVMMMTMIDAKVCNAVTNTKSTMKCYICGASSKDFNNLSLSGVINQDNLKFGLSILHARIRVFEALLHLSYKLTIKKWQLRNETDKKIAKDRKLKIQEDFKNKMGLLVDVPKAGFGNTNDGNTSRRFFMEPDLSAEITGVDPRLVYRLKVILETISSGYNIDTNKFNLYCLETAKLYVELYSWHPMTPTLHKILIHGPVVIEKALLPIGMLSEEAAEARNKHFRLYRLNYARKFDRESCNLDVINRLLLTSDPLITGMRPVPRKTTEPFLKETIDMFLPTDADMHWYHEDSYDEETTHNSEESDKEVLSSEEST